MIQGRRSSGIGPVYDLKRADVFNRIQHTSRSPRADDVAGSTERPTVNWFMWLWLSTVLLLFVDGGAILGGAGQAMELAFRNALGRTDPRYWTFGVAVVSMAVLRSRS